MALAGKLAILDVMSSSSSSSSSDDEDEINVILATSKDKIPVIKNFISDVVQRFSDEEFKKNFRMDRSTAYHVIEQYRNSTFYPTQPHAVAQSISAENHVLSFLWFAGNKCCLRDGAQWFGIGATTLYRQVMRVTHFLVDIAPEVIKFPQSKNEKEHMASEFLKISDFPNVLGCIDGTSINIRTPAHKIKSTYTNRHDLPAIMLQGICSASRKFVDVFTGAPGKIHDARVLMLSDINEKLPELCGKKYHLLGDGAYGIREWLLTPYKDYGNLINSKRNFNYKLPATRALIENTFGILKGRFRQLMQINFHKVSKIRNFLIACCVLHNFCIDNNDFLDDEYVDADCQSTVKMLTILN